jgi:hypothetical protein
MLVWLICNHTWCLLIGNHTCIMYCWVAIHVFWLAIQHMPYIVGLHCMFADVNHKIINTWCVIDGQQCITNDQCIHDWESYMLSLIGNDTNIMYWWLAMHGWLIDWQPAMHHALLVDIACIINWQSNLYDHALLVIFIDWQSSMHHVLVVGNACITDWQNIYLSSIVGCQCMISDWLHIHASCYHTCIMHC